MMPTLVQGDYIFVKKFQYGLRLPVTETKILETGSPQRGDVVVFRLPSDPGINYIKRVVGLPGDEIVYSRQRLFVNGEPAPTAPSNNIEVRGAALYVDDELVMPVLDERQPYSDFKPYSETLGVREHSILLEMRPDDGFVGRYRVPEGHYFMMGDNRDRSKDSRYIGAIPESYLVGEAVLIWMHMDGIEWPNWGRIGTSIE
jgi:signal peptidase I